MKSRPKNGRGDRFFGLEEAVFQRVLGVARQGLEAAENIALGPSP
jgi:hypothetical protein